MADVTRADREAAVRVFFDVVGTAWPSDAIAHWVARGEEWHDGHRQLGAVAAAIAQARAEGYAAGVKAVAQLAARMAPNDGTVSGERALSEFAEYLIEGTIVP